MPYPIAPWAGFLDSRGLPVTQMPDILLPSASLVIVHEDDLSFPPPWYIVVHQRSDNHWWGLPGGRMEIGESIVQCAVREALEETGLVVRIVRLLCFDSDPCAYAISVYPDGRIVQYCNLTFLATASQGLLQASAESDEVCWAHMDDLPEPFLPAQRARVSIARDNLEGVPVR